MGLPILVEALCVIGGFIVVSVGLGVVIHRTVPRDLLREHNDLAGFTFAVVGVIYAVLLGFIAIGVWERYSSADENTFIEAASLTSVYRDVAAFPEAKQIRSDLRHYTSDIITKAWPTMETGGESFMNDTEAERISKEIREVRPRDSRETTLQQQMIVAMQSSLAARDQRLTADATGLNGVMWTVVIVGGFITVAFTYLFGFNSAHMQAAMIGALAMLIGLVLFLTMSLDYPFRGAVHIGPEAFHRALKAFDVIDAAPDSYR